MGFSLLNQPFLRYPHDYEDPQIQQALPLSGGIPVVPPLRIGEGGEVMGEKNPFPNTNTSKKQRIGIRPLHDDSWLFMLGSDRSTRLIDRSHWVRLDDRYDRWTKRTYIKNGERDSRIYDGGHHLIASSSCRRCFGYNFISCHVFVATSRLASTK